MKGKVCAVMLLFLMVSLAGCVTVKKVTRERVDQDIAGNQGYIGGATPAPRKAEAGDREYIDVRVEVPTWGEVKKSLPEKRTETKGPKRGRTDDRGVSGNKGYLTSSRGFEETLPPVYKEKPAPLISKATAPPPAPAYKYEELEEEGLMEVPKDVVTTYKVKKGDTLSKIAKDFYGKASKWTIIYEANSDKIKDPDRLKVGTKLVIPDLEEAESAYIK